MREFLKFLRDLQTVTPVEIEAAIQKLGAGWHA